MPQQQLQQGHPAKTILLGISGGIAAYKVCDLARQLVRAGHRVKVVMTEHATQFVGPATFRSLTDNPVALDLFDDPTAPINHISLAEEADIMLIAPATANVIAKLAQGRADDLLSTTALAFQGQLLIAPAMNTQMYLDPATQENLKMLTDRGAVLIGPASGELACGASGLGRMVEADELFKAVEECVHTSTRLTGKVLISAGPTKEYLDPVRYLSNRSSGKMGIALAREALRAGAEVSLVLGPVSEAVPVDKKLKRIDVVSAEDMYEAMMAEATDADLIICAAAVADYKPAQLSLPKIKKDSKQCCSDSQVGVSTNNDNCENSGNILPIDFVQNPDILAELGSMKARGELKEAVVLVGFAAETDNLDSNVRAKLERKGADFIVANDVSRADTGFESDDNEVHIFSKACAKMNTLSSCALNAEQVKLLSRASKTLIARQILETVYTES